MYGRTARYYLAGWGVSKISLRFNPKRFGRLIHFDKCAYSFFQHGVAKNSTTLTRNRRNYFVRCMWWWLLSVLFMDDGWWMMKMMRSMTMLTMMNDEWWSRLHLGGGVSSCGAERFATHLPTLARCGLLAWVRGRKKAKGRVFWGVIKLEPIFF